MYNMRITQEMVRELREKTGAGMIDCKKALMETNGNMNAAERLVKTHFNVGFACGRMESSREFDCEYCKKTVCENEYDKESVKCRRCKVRKCMEKMTLGDQIRAMSDKELGNFLFNFMINCASNPDFIKEPSGYEKMLKEKKRGFDYEL